MKRTLAPKKKPTTTTTSSASLSGSVAASKKTSLNGSLSRTLSSVTNTTQATSPTPSSMNKSSGIKRTLTSAKATSSSSKTPSEAGGSRPGTARNMSNAATKKSGGATGFTPRTLGGGSKGSKGVASSSSSRSPRSKNFSKNGNNNNDSDSSNDLVSPQQIALSEQLVEETATERRLRKAQEKEAKKQKKEEERLKKKEMRSKLARARQARAVKNTKIPDWLLLGGAEILESFDHPVELATLMATSRQVRDKVVLPNIHEQVGPLASGFVLSSKEYLPEVENPRPINKLNKKIEKELGKQFDCYESSSDDDDSSLDLHQNKKRDDGEGEENEDDTPPKVARESTGLFEEENYDDEAHEAGAMLKLFSATQHVIPEDTQVFNLNGSCLPDKTAGDIFFRSILTPLLKENETVKRAEFGLLKREFYYKDKEEQLEEEHEELSEFEREGRKIISHIKYPIGGELKDMRISEFISISPDVGLVNDRTVSLLGQRNHNLRYLDISGRTEVTGVGLSVVACCCTKILHLNLSFTNVTDSSMCLLASYCRLMKNLAVEGCDKLSDRAISSVSIWCPQLVSLNVSRTRGKITDLSLGEIIARCHSLERLVAHSCDGGVTDKTLMALSRPPFVTNAALFTEREMSPEETDDSVSHGYMTMDSSSQSPNRSLQYDEDNVLNNNHSNRSHDIVNNNNQFNSSHQNNKSSSSNTAKNSDPTKLQAPCLWTTLKEVDVRGANGKVTWTGGMLNVLQHTATEHEKRRRIKMRRLRMMKSRGDSDSNNSPSAVDPNDTTPRLIVYVDIEILDELPEESPVLANVKGMLKFESVVDF